MKSIFKLIDEEKSHLSNHELINWISTTDHPLTFAPAMTFFVLGFRDILSYLKRKSPKDVWDHAINVHCEEDANHWLWFIEDLQKIGVDETDWGKNFSSLLTQTWSENGYAARDMVYTLIHFAKTNNDPFVNLALIESLEAAFAVFINVLMPTIEKNGWQNELRYFGSRHHEDESNHALGTWVGDTSIDTNLHNVQLTDRQRDEATIILRETFVKFHILFESWYNQKDSFQGRFTPTAQHYTQATLSN